MKAELCGSHGELAWNGLPKGRSWRCVFLQVQILDQVELKHWRLGRGVNFASLLPQLHLSSLVDLDALSLEDRTRLAVENYFIAFCALQKPQNLIEVVNAVALMREKVHGGPQNADFHLDLGRNHRENVSARLQLLRGSRYSDFSQQIFVCEDSIDRHVERRLLRFRRLQEDHFEHYFVGDWPWRFSANFLSHDGLLRRRNSYIRGVKSYKVRICGRTLCLVFWLVEEDF